ncbi:MAG: multicopper oxidase domain-containing protein [Candidatus Korobacteraceae bacterium]
MFAISVNGAWASSSGIADQVCSRTPAGSAVEDPPELRSQTGVLEVTLHFKYQPTFSGQGPPRYCYVTDKGEEAPTLRVNPGDRLIIHLHNDLPANHTAPAPGAMEHSGGAGERADSGDCHPGPMSASVTNLHFHGLNIPPTCHQDDVLRTLIQPGETFDYRVTIPRDEPPGLYWYHPHPHGYSERQVQGGGSGALIVEGIEKANPSLAKLPQRLIVLRDQPLSERRRFDPLAPAWDVSINYIPVIYPAYEPAVIETRGSGQEFWRVLNAGADTIFDLQLLVAGVAQPVQIVALDGVPVTSAHAAQTSILLPPGARAEFVVATPKPGRPAQLVTKRWDTGPDGDSDPDRPIANVVSKDSVQPVSMYKPERMGHDRTANHGEPLVERRLYFSEISPNAGGPDPEADLDASVFYFLTVAGQQPAMYRMDQPPNIVVHQGDVEDWVVENRAREDHVFHIHQIHFQVIEVDGKPVTNAAMRDTVNLPHWDGSGPYPSVKLRMDFRDPNIVGTFLYHCHILKHEDMGMMGAIEVLPSAVPTSTALTTPSAEIDLATSIMLTAKVMSGNSGEAPPGGSVQFAVDGINAGRPVALEQGRAIFHTSFEESGAHRITATYSGDAGYDESAGAIRIKVSRSY